MSVQDTPSRFIISRPDDQVNLTPEIPQGEVPTHYINRYHADHDVACAFCDKHTPHRRGFTAEMADGRIALCGRDCAIKYFGKEVADSFEADLEAEVRKESKRKILERTLQGVPLCLELITEDLVTTEQVYLEACDQLGYCFKDSGIHSKILKNGRYEHTETRTTWEDKEDRYGVMKRVPNYQEVVILQIEGVSVLKADHTTQSGFAQARRELLILSKAKTTSDYSDEVVERILKKRQAIIQSIERSCRFLDNCLKMFSKDNIKALNKFSKVSRSTLQGVALHKAVWGYKLIIEPVGYYDDEDYFGGAEKKILPLPDLTGRPTLSTLKDALREGGTSS